MRWWSGSVWVLLIVLISAAASGAGGLQVDPCAQWYQLRQVLTDLLSSGPANSGRVNCGGHHAPDCGSCPGPGHHYEWCNGDCVWSQREERCNPATAVTDAALPVFAAMKIVQAAACGEARPGPGVDQDSIEQSVGVEEEPAPADLEEVNEVEDPFDLEEVEDMSCIASADDYTAYLERLLTRPVSRYFRKICPWLNLFTTVEALDAETGNTPVTLSQSRFWAFASGKDAAENWLIQANNFPTRQEFTQYVLLTVGFGPEDIDLSGGIRYQMIVFNNKLGDKIWRAGMPAPELLPEAHQQSFQPVWKQVFSYLSSDFMVCSSPSVPRFPPVSVARDCEVLQAVIPVAAQTEILSLSYSDLTGCRGGFPEARPGGGGGVDCRARCPGSQGETYCQYIAAFQAAYLLGSRGCVDMFNSESRGEAEEARWARAFFEVCFDFNPYFTGLGVGYNEATRQTTFTEWLVRGDVALEDMEFSAVDIYK